MIRMLAIPRSAAADGEIRSSTALIVVNTFTPATSSAGKTAMPVPGDLRCDSAGWLAHLTNVCCAVTIDGENRVERVEHRARLLHG